MVTFKKNIIKSISLLFILFHAIFMSAITGFAASTSTVKTSYTDINNLTSDQQKTIIYSKPNFKIQHDQEEVILVYRPISLLKDDSQNMLKSTSDKSTSKNYTSSPSTIIKTFPKTGDQANIVFPLVGCLLFITILLVFLFKRRFLKKFLLFSIIIGNIGLLETVKASAVDLLPSKTESLELGSAYSNQLQTIKDYDYIGYIRGSKNKDTPPTKSKGIVEVSYVDENNKELSPAIELSGNIGDNYQSEAKEIPGYILTEIPINSKGKFTEKKQTVSFIYKVIPQKSEVIVNYLDDSGAALIDPIILTGTIGENYQTNVQDIPGYKLTVTPENASGKFTSEKQTVNYIYCKENIEATITIKFVDGNGEPFVLPDLTTENNGSYNPFYPNLEKYYMKLDYKDIRYDQGKPVDDIVIPTKIGESYSLPAKMRFTIYDDKDTLVDYIASPGEDGVFTGICYWENYEDYPDNINGKIETNDVIVTYRIFGYGYTTPEA
ncbi:MucBP domain-containing protein [Enterococcus sp. DIV0187]|uniref:MucBP domain-containing protein n=1 Tax=Enterococcus sp. DIV0187 TaxID=2774644 RepID=UPI003F1FC772